MDHGVGIGPTWFAFKARLGYQQPAREQNGWRGRGRTYVGRFRGGRPAIRRLSRKWQPVKEFNLPRWIWSSPCSRSPGHIGGKRDSTITMPFLAPAGFKSAAAPRLLHFP